MEILIFLACLVGVIAFALLWNAMIVWVLCWGLRALGILTIGTFVVQFSWPLVVVLTVISMFFKGIFNISIKKRD